MRFLMPQKLVTRSIALYIISVCPFVETTRLTRAADSIVRPVGRKQIPLEDFFRNPNANSYDLSPDGKWLAFMQPWKNRMNLFIRPTEGGTAKRITNETERNIDRYFWKGNDRIIFFKDYGGNENYHAFLTLRKGGKVVDLTPFPNVQAKLVDVWFDSD